MDTVEELIESLQRYVYGIAISQSRTHTLSVLLDVEDIVSELQIEILVCWNHYSTTVGSSQELQKIARTMLSHRMGELIYKYHGTHRKAEISNGSLEEGLGVESSDPSISPSEFITSQERISDFVALLDPEELQIVEAILDPNHRGMKLWTRMYAMRRSAIYANPTMKISYSLVADALHLDRARTKELFRRIKKKWRLVYG